MSDSTTELDQIEEAILTCDVSDEFIGIRGGHGECRSGELHPGVLHRIY